jgi:EF hand domain-containing protein
MNGPREPKKSESFEVRLSHDAKRALMEKARIEGRSASEVIRTSIDTYLAEQRKEDRSMFVTLWKPAAAIGAATIAILWTALAPTAVQARPALKALFQTLDGDRNGAVTLDEFLKHAADPAIAKAHHDHMSGMSEGMADHMSGMSEGMAATHAKFHGTQVTQPMLRAHFAHLDANSDGSVTFAEFKAFHDKMEGVHRGR